MQRVEVTRGALQDAQIGLGRRVELPGLTQCQRLGQRVFPVGSGGHRRSNSGSKRDATLTRNFLPGEVLPGRGCEANVPPDLRRLKAMVDLDAYLGRLGYDGTLAPTEACLAA